MKTTIFLKSNTYKPIIMKRIKKFVDQIRKITFDYATKFQQIYRVILFNLRGNQLAQFQCTSLLRQSQNKMLKLKGIIEQFNYHKLRKHSIKRNLSSKLIECRCQHIQAHVQLGIIPYSDGVNSQQENNLNSSSQMNQRSRTYKKYFQQQGRILKCKSYIFKKIQKIYYDKLGFCIIKVEEIINKQESTYSKMYHLENLSLSNQTQKIQPKKQIESVTINQQSFESKKIINKVTQPLSMKDYNKKSLYIFQDSLSKDITHTGQEFLVENKNIIFKNENECIEINSEIDEIENIFSNLKSGNDQKNIRSFIRKNKQNGYEIQVNLRNEQMTIYLTQVERQKLLNLIKNNKNSGINNILKRILIQQLNTKQQKLQQNQKKIIHFKELKQCNKQIDCILEENLNNNNKQMVEQSQQILKSSIVISSQVQSDTRNSNFYLSQLKSEQIDTLCLQEPFNKRNYESYLSNKLLGGGCGTSKVVAVDDVLRLKDEFNKNPANIDEDDEDFDKEYQEHFRQDKILVNMKSTKISTKLRLTIQGTLIKFNETIVQYDRIKVIDIINLIIDYMFVTFNKGYEKSKQRDIDFLTEELKKIQGYCYDDRETFPSLDLHLYLDILITLNSKRIGKDEANKHTLVKIAQKLIKLGQVVSGFMSIAGAVQTLMDIDFGKTYDYFEKLYELFISCSLPEDIIDIEKNALNIPSSYKKGNPNTNEINNGQKQEEVNEEKQKEESKKKKSPYNNNNLFVQIYTLWIRRVQYLRENITNPYEELVFYLIELDESQIEDEDMIKFIFMQINYLLGKVIKQNKLQELAEKIIQNDKQNIIIEFVNQLQIKKYNENAYQFVQTLVSLITSSEQFRYLKASILLKLAQLISCFGQKELEEKIMISLCLNYISEKKLSVKIVYQNNQMMYDFIQKIEDYHEQIIEESKSICWSKFKLKNPLQDIQETIENKEDITKQLANSLIQMWEITARQRHSLNQIAHKDDSLLETIQLYVQQSITHQDGHNIVTDSLQSSLQPEIKESQQNQQQSQTNNALTQIIQNFLIPNYTYPKSQTLSTEIKKPGTVNEKKSDQNTVIQEDLQNKEDINLIQPENQIENDLQKEQQTENQERKQCKILTILADGGTGKSMLLKKLEVELINNKFEYLKNKEDRERAQFIPLTIKCNSLNIENPSIELYLQQQNLNPLQINALKSSERNKLILLDGYDEFAGKYFKIFHKLKIYEWVNTLVIVTSRLEKISVSDAQVYFNFYDENEKKGDGEQYSVVKLEKFTDSDIEEYLNRFKQQTKKMNKNFKMEEFEKVKTIINKNKSLIQLLKLPINLYLTTRMMVDINLEGEKILSMFNTATDQIEIQELFFQEQFFKNATKFVSDIKFNDKNKQKQVIENVKSSFFEYFQLIAMKMFLQKGKKDNFLSTTKDQLKYEIRKANLEYLDDQQIQELYKKLDSYVDSRVITRIQSTNNQSAQNNKSENNKIQQEISNQKSLEFEFRHKSIFEYFAARAMKFDFDINKDIYKLSLAELKKFNINQRSIMNAGYNQSEQQILLKLFKLIDYDQDKVDYMIDYSFEEIEKNNRYIQYIRLSYIEKQDQISDIDIGSSNLLSALFVSKFQYTKLRLNQCSLSRLYTENRKDIIFDSCNLNNAYLKNFIPLFVETSYTQDCVFGSVFQAYRAENLYNVTEVIIESNTLIAINNKGYINSFKLKSNQQQHDLLQSKRITSSPLYQMDNYLEKYIVVRSQYSIFLINKQDFQIQKVKRFDETIDDFKCSKNNIVIKLIHGDIHFGNFQEGFKLIRNEDQILSFSIRNELFVIGVKSQNGNRLIIYQITNQDISELERNEIDIEPQKLNYSTDGKYLICGDEQTVQILIVDNKYKMKHSIQCNPNYLYEQIHSPANGQYLVIRKADSYCEIYSLENPNSRIHIIEAKDIMIKFIDFTDDGKYLIAGDKQSIFKVWNIEKKFEEVYKIQRYQNEIRQVCYSNTNKYFATSSWDKSFQIWDTQNNFSLIHTINGHDGSAINSIQFSSDGKYFATCSEDKTCKIWDVEKEFQLFHSITDHTKRLTQIYFTADSKYLVTGSDDLTIRVWNVKEKFKHHKTIEVESNISQLVISANNKYMAVRLMLSGVKILDMGNGYQELDVLKDKNYYQILFSPDCKYLISTSKSSFDVLSVEKGFSCINTIKTNSGDISSLAFSLDTKYLATGSNDSCNIWNIEKGFLHMNTIENQGKLNINSLSFSADGKYLATCSDNTYKIWHLERGFESLKQVQSHIEDILSIAFSENNKYLATTSNNICKIWNAAKNFELLYTLEDHTQKLTHLAFDPCNVYFATTSLDKTCKIWNMDQGFRLIKNITDHANQVFSVVFSSNGKQVVTISNNLTFKIRNVEKQFEILHTIEDQELQYGKSYHMHFSPNNKYLVISDDSHCHVWSLDKNIQKIKKLKVNSSKGVNFSVDGKYLVVGSNVGSFLYNVDAEEKFELHKTIEQYQTIYGPVDFSKDSKYLAVSDASQFCSIINMEEFFKQKQVDIKQHKINWKFADIFSIDEREFIFEEIFPGFKFECQYLL